MDQMYRIGHSRDIHRLVENRKLILGGVEIPYELGLLGHSDADCVYHAVAESIIGALGKGDLGMHFSDEDNKYKDMDSSYFVLEAYKMMNEENYEINNMDIIVYCERPKLAEYKEKMRENIAFLLKTDVLNINVKATRGEGIGEIGHGEGIACEAIVLIKKINN